MNDSKALGVALLAVVIAVGGILVQSHKISALQAAVADLTEGVGRIGSAFPHGLSIGDTANPGQTVTNTTTNTATSTLVTGCFQTYATSTATVIHFEISTTTSLATYSGGSAPTGGLGGGVSWRYGSCPV